MFLPFNPPPGAPFWGGGDVQKGPVAPEAPDTRYSGKGQGARETTSDKHHVTAEPRDIFWNKVYAPDAWQTVRLNGHQLPGRCEVVFKQKVRIQQAKASGSDGARPIRHGIDPGEFDIRCFLWTADQFRQLQAILPRLWTPSGKPSNEAVSFEHPTASIWRIPSIMINAVQGPAPGGNAGEMVLTFSCSQWFPAPVAAKKRKTKQETEVEKKADITRTSSSAEMPVANFSSATGNQSISPPSADVNFSGPL